MHYTESMENPGDDMADPTPPPADDGRNDDDSLETWINRAKRAHELVEAVDLEKVAAHDAGEIHKLDSVSDALQQLSEGNAPDHVEGVDEVIPALDAEQQRRADLMAVIAEDGWVERMSRVLTLADGGATLRPLEIIPHREGLPDFDICVAPEEAIGIGNFALFVSATGIFAASINEPASKHLWRIARSRPYETIDELRGALRNYATTAFE